jgi:hypothetical protein
VASSIVVVLGVLLFAVDRLEEASVDARSSLQGAPATWPGSTETGRSDTPGAAVPDEPSRVEQLIADANDVLRAPFVGLVPPTAGVWIRELVPALLALLLWGVGLSKVGALLSRAARPQRYVSTRVP